MTHEYNVQLVLKREVINNQPPRDTQKIYYPFHSTSDTIMVQHAYAHL